MSASSPTPRRTAHFVANATQRYIHSSWQQSTRLVLRAAEERTVGSVFFIPFFFFFFFHLPFRLKQWLSRDYYTCQFDRTLLVIHILLFYIVATCFDLKHAFVRPTVTTIHIALHVYSTMSLITDCGHQITQPQYQRNNSSLYRQMCVPPMCLDIWQLTVTKQQRFSPAFWRGSTCSNLG
jgi:hypothetical protein